MNTARLPWRTLDERAVTLRRLTRFSDASRWRAFNSSSCCCNYARSLYLPGCLSSFAEPPLVGLTLVCGADLHRSCALYVPDGHGFRRVVILSVATLLRHATQNCLPEPSSNSLSRSVTGTCTLLASYASKRHHVCSHDALILVRRHSYGDYTE